MYAVRADAARNREVDEAVRGVSSEKAYLAQHGFMVRAFDRRTSDEMLAVLDYQQLQIDRDELRATTLSTSSDMHLPFFADMLAVFRFSLRHIYPAKLPRPSSTTNFLGGKSWHLSGINL